MSRELLRDAHNMAQMLREQAWTDDHVRVVAMIEDLAITLSACRQARTNAQRDNQRLATLSACQDTLINTLRAATKQLTNQLALVTEKVAS